MSKARQSVLLLAVVAAGLALTIGLTASAYSNTPTHVESAENESLTQDFDTYQTVTKSQDPELVNFYDNESVYNSQGQELNEGTHYEWNTTDGSILFLSSGKTNEGNNASINYWVEERPDSAADKLGPIANFLDIAGILPLLLIVAGVFGAIKQLNTGAGTGGRR